MTVDFRKVEHKKMSSYSCDYIKTYLFTFPFTSYLPGPKVTKVTPQYRVTPVKDWSFVSRFDGVSRDHQYWTTKNDLCN